MGSGRAVEPGTEKGWKGNSRHSALQKSTPRTELPSGSSRGDHVEMPVTPGTTMHSTPDTPDLVGMPTRKPHSPE